MFSFVKFTNAAAALTVAVALSAPLSGAFAAGTASAPSDAEITGAVRAQLAKDSAVSADHLHVRTVDGVVYLEGAVDNSLEQDAAEKLAAQSAGVIRVVDETNVASSGD